MPNFKMELWMFGVHWTKNKFGLFQLYPFKYLTSIKQKAQSR